MITKIFDFTLNNIRYKKHPSNIDIIRVCDFALYLSGQLFVLVTSTIYA
jgi:hypothetical protein